jgi:ribonucleoside-diphosphate reductase alpha chain
LDLFDSQASRAVPGARSLRSVNRGARKCETIPISASRARSPMSKRRAARAVVRAFLWALRRGAIPAGRVTSNAGALEHKPATSTINCTVSGTIRDSMDDILKKVHEAGLTLKAGCGIGYEFSTLRPRGAYVSGAGAYTSRARCRSWISTTRCASPCPRPAAGAARRWARSTSAIPDVLEFIRAKRENGRLRQFNLSLLITDEFMQAVEDDGDWPLAFPSRQGNEARSRS